MLSTVVIIIYHNRGSCILQITLFLKFKTASYLENDNLLFSFGPEMFTER